jgi:hypothetical protein
MRYLPHKMLPWLTFATMHPPFLPQVHLTFWSGTAVLVSWASCDAKLGQNYPVSTDNIRSVVYYATNSGKLDQKTEGVATSYAYDYTALKGNGINYASPVLHHVLLKGEHSGGMGALTKGGISVISQRKCGRHDKQAMHITLQQCPGHGVKLLGRLPCVQKVQVSIPARRKLPFFGATALSLSVLLSGLCPCGASVRGRGFGHFASTKCHPV